jgi:hypothetical protein
MRWRVWSPNSFYYLTENIVSPAVRWGPEMEIWQVECGEELYTPLLLKCPASSPMFSLFPPHSHHHLVDAITKAD